MMWLLAAFAVAVPMMSFGLHPILQRIHGRSVEWAKLVGSALLFSAGVYLTGICAANAVLEARQAAAFLIINAMEEGK